MTADSVLQILVYGIIMGALYGLAAAGFTLVFGVMKVLNIAHGAFMMLGGYLSFWAFTLYQIDPFVSLLFVGPILFLVGLVFYIVQVHPVIRFTDEHDKIHASLLISFGLSVVLEHVAMMLWTGDVRSITPSYSGAVVVLLGARVPVVGIAGIGFALVHGPGSVSLSRQDPLREVGEGNRGGLALRDPHGSQHQLDIPDFVRHRRGAGGNRRYPGLCRSQHRAQHGPLLDPEGHDHHHRGRRGQHPRGACLRPAARAGGIHQRFCGGASYREVVGLVALVLILMVKPKGLFTQTVKKV